MENSFYEGYRYFLDNNKFLVGAKYSSDYINSIVDSIDDFAKVLNDRFSNNHSDIDKLKGFVLEEWHAGTFNINAKARLSADRAHVVNSHDFGSVDIHVDSIGDYSAKAYKTAKASAMAQSTSYENASKMKSNSLKIEDVDPSKLNDSIYKGQFRIVPSDQVFECIKSLDRKILKESSIRPDQVERYVETRNRIVGKIENKTGESSVEINLDDLRDLTKLAKENKVDSEALEKLNVTVKNMASAEAILKTSFKAGVTAAIVTFVLETAPIIIDSIRCYIAKDNELDFDMLKDKGLNALSDTGKSFVLGAISSAFISYARSGKLGKEFQKAEPMVVGAIVALTFSIISETIKWTSKELSNFEFVTNTLSNVVSTIAGTLLGIYGSNALKHSIIGFLVGNLVGTIVASIAMGGAKKLFVSFCVRNGYTMFGLVKQDYTLPEDVLLEAGLDTIKFNEINLDLIKYDKINFNKINFSKSNFKETKMKFVKRGLIEVDTVGFILN